MKVQKVVIENFKGIKKAEFDLAGKSVFVIGKNHTGKTSLVDGIFKNLETSVSDKGKVSLAKINQPLNKDAKKGFVETHISNENGEYVVKNIFSEGGKRKLEITSPDGFKTTTVASLNTLVGAIDFNMGEFIELGRTVPGRREQVRIIKDFIPDEVLDKMDEIDSEIESQKETRKIINSDIRNLKVSVSSSDYTTEDIKEHSSKKDIADLNKKYQDAVKHNSSYDLKVKELETANENIAKDETALENFLKSKREEAKELQARLEKLNATIADQERKGNAKIEAQSKEVDKLEEEVDKFNPIDTTSIQKEIEDISTFNQKVGDITKWKIDSSSLKNKEDEYKERGERIVELEKEKKDLVANSELPIKGLTFDEDGLYLNGVEISSMSTSEQIEQIGVPIAIAKEPNVKIIRVAFGESCDFDTLTRIREKAEAMGYQLITEEVCRNVEEMKVEFIEDYLK